MIYTKEALQEVVEKSFSVSEVIRRLGKKITGGTHSHVTKKIKKFEIDTSHFLGQATSSKKNGGNNKKRWDEILIKGRNDKREHSYLLRRSLIEMGREYVCELCGQLPEWKGKELRLQVDHVDRNWLDNRPENVRFLCPNCHTQTEGHNGSKGICGVTKGNYDSRPKGDPEWRTKPKPEQRKVERPPYEELLTEVGELGYKGTGRKYGVSDNAIRKWLKVYENNLKD